MQANFERKEDHFQTCSQSIFFLLFSIPSAIAAATSSAVRPLFLSPTFSCPRTVSWATALKTPAAPLKR